MHIGYIGLGKMGSNMVERLREKGHVVSAYNKTPEPLEKVKEKGVQVSSSISELVQTLPTPRFVWMMVPYTAVEGVLAELTPHLVAGDVVVDGGNSPYEDSKRRADELRQKEVHFLDVGVSGGPSGARHGACMMIGGRREVYEEHESLFKDLCASDGYGYMGESGAGHFVKMVHNGIEYGMMQAIAEGFHVMKCAPFNLDLIDIARIYNHGSVVESRLMEWLGSGLKEHGADLDDVTGRASASGEGEWMVKTAETFNISVDVISNALRAREASQTSPNYQGKIISLLRNQFGGHDLHKKTSE